MCAERQGYMAVDFKMLPAVKIRYANKGFRFADSPFVRRKLEHASVLCADGKEYTIKTIDDHDAGWLMVTLDIPDATVLWDKELESK